MNDKYKVYGENPSNIKAIYYRLIEFCLEKSTLNIIEKNTLKNYLKKLRAATSEAMITEKSDDLIAYINKKSSKFNSIEKINLDEKTIKSIISSTVHLHNQSQTAQKIYEELPSRTKLAIEYMVKQIRKIKQEELKQSKNVKKENEQKERLVEKESSKVEEYKPKTSGQYPETQNFSTKKDDYSSDKSIKKPLSNSHIIEQIINKYLNSDISLANIYRNLKDDFYALGIQDEIYIKKCFIEIANQRFLNMNKLFVKNKPNVGDLHRLAIAIFETLPKVLINNKVSMDNATILNGLTTYEKAYLEYVKYYQRLSKADKQNQEFFARHVNPDPYRTILGEERNEFYIISPEDLRKAVNKKVTRNMQERHEFSYMYNESGATHKISYSTQFMTIEEIVKTYNEIKRVNKENRIYNEEELKMCQLNFAYVILKKENKELSKLTQTEIDEEIKNICEKYFKEESLTKILANKQTKKSIIEEKFYKLSKINKTIEEIKKEYPRFVILMEKENKTEKEQEELENMFKGARK